MVLIRGKFHIIERLLEAFKDSGIRNDSPHAESKVSRSRLSAFLAQGRVEIKTLKMWMTVIVIVTVLVMSTLGIVAALATCIGALATLCVWIRKKITSRRLSLDRDLPALLTTVASSVRAGVDPLVAIGNSREYFAKDSVVRCELDRFHHAMVHGAAEGDLIDAFCGDIEHPDLPLVRGCLLLARRHGSSLAEPLHRVIRVVRQRQSFRRKTRGALVMHRMSAVGIVLCALVIAAMQAAMNVEGIRQAAVHPTGGKVLTVGVVCIVGGVVWMMGLGTRGDV